MFNMNKDSYAEKPLIMIVDDNSQNIKVLGNILEGNGYDTAVFLNGESAIEFAKTEDPSLILLDIMMPEMDGFEVCEELKRNMATASIPIIFITAKAETEDIVKGFDLGAVDYITKPFNSSELLARVKTHVEMKILKGLIPICSKCKNIRDDKDHWTNVERYIQENSQALFSHSLCPSCTEELYGEMEWYKKKKNKN